MLRSIFLVFTVISLLILSAPGSAQDVPASYQQALGYLQEKNLPEALKAFAETDAAHPDNIYTLYNWGLAAYSSSQKGLAVGLWRRALYLDPHFGPAQRALDFAQIEMPREAFFPPGIGLIENLKLRFLRNVSINNLLLTHLLLLTFSGWLFIRYFSHRKKAIGEEAPPPPVPAVGILFALLLIAASFVLAVAIQFFSEARATVIAPNTPLRTAAQEEASTIFNLLEGGEVVIREVQGDWTLVTYPGGMSGWVPRSSLYQNHGKKLW